AAGEGAGAREGGSVGRGGGPDPAGAEGGAGGAERASRVGADLRSPWRLPRGVGAVRGGAGAGSGQRRGVVEDRCGARGAGALRRGGPRAEARGASGA